MSAELERRLRALERKFANLENRRTHVWRNTPALDEDAAVASGAPDDAQYVTLALDGDLSAERVLTAGTGIAITDGGANGNVTVDATSGIATFVPNGLVRGFGWWLPGGTTTPTNHGLHRNLLAGSITHVAPGSGDLRASVRRWQNTSGPSAGGSSAAERGFVGTGQEGRCFWRGNAAGLGGFFVAMLGMTGTMDANTRCFFGLLGETGSAGPASTIDPSTLLDSVFIGADDTDGNLQVMHNDSAGACTKVDLGIDKTTLSSRLYDFFLYAAPNGSEIEYRVIRRDAAGDQSGVLNSNLPTNTAFMGALYHTHYPGGNVAATNYQTRGLYGEWGIGQGVEHYGYF